MQHLLPEIIKAEFSYVNAGCYKETCAVKNGRIQASSSEAPSYVWKTFF